MKNIIFSSLILSLVATAAMAQDPKPKSRNAPSQQTIDESTVQEPTNYYPNTSGTITMSGYTYKYRNYKAGKVEVTGMIELYNSDNSFLDVKWGYKDGTEATFEELMGQVLSSEYISDSSQTKAETLAMVKGCFSTYQKTLLRGKSMGITVRFDSSTGRIADVYFDFSRDDPFVNIPVETYRSVELALKQNLTVTMTAKGKRLMYKQTYWTQDF
jgi:hypothetical protein